MIYILISNNLDNKLSMITEPEPEIFNIWQNWIIPSMTRKKKSIKSMTQCGTKETFKSSESNPKIFLSMLRILAILILTLKGKRKESKTFIIKGLAEEQKKRIWMDFSRSSMKHLEKTMLIKIEGSLIWKNKGEVFRTD